MPPIIPPKRVGLSRITVFQGLSPQDFSRIEQNIFPRIIKANSALLTEGETNEWVYFILEGTVRISRSQRNGTHLILNMVGAGEMLGEPYALDNQSHSASALATEATAVYSMRRRDFCDFEETLPQLSKNVKNLLAHRLSFATSHNELLAERKVHLRVARLLLALTNHYASEPDQETVPLPLRLTQKEIAGWACVSRQHADKHLAQLCECGVVRMNTGHRIVICDRFQLILHCD